MFGWCWIQSLTTSRQQVLVAAWRAAGAACAAPTATAATRAASRIVVWRRVVCMRGGAWTAGPVSRCGVFSGLSRCKPFVSARGYGPITMLASPAVRPVDLGRGDRVLPAAAGLALCICALFFAGGLSDAPLVWIGGLALLAAALCLVWSRPLGTPALVYLGCLWGLAIW